MTVVVGDDFVSPEHRGEAAGNIDHHPIRIVRQRGLQRRRRGPVRELNDVAGHQTGHADAHEVLRGGMRRIANPGRRERGQQHRALPEHLADGERRHRDGQHRGQDHLWVGREFHYGHQGGEGGLQHGRHHSRHSEHHVERGFGSEFGRQRIARRPEQSAEQSAHDEGRPDHADRKTDADTGRGRHGLGDEDDQQHGPGEVVEQSLVDGVVADAEGLRGEDRGRAGDRAGHGCPHPERPGPQLGERLHQGDEQAADDPHDESRQHDEGHLEQRTQIGFEPRELDDVAEKPAAQHGGRHGGDDDRDETHDRVLHHHHLHGEDDAGHGRVEGRPDGCGRAASNQRADAVVG